MRNSTHSSPLSVSYARSLLELANESGQVEPIGQELHQILEILEANPAFGEFLADPGISTEERKRKLDHIFRGRIAPLLMNFLGVLNENNRLSLLRQIGNAYSDLLDELLGNIEVDVTVAQRLTPAELDQVRERVSQVLGRKAVVHQYVDESIIGGLVLRVEDRLIDSSVRYQLQAIRRQLLSRRPATA